MVKLNSENLEKALDTEKKHEIPTQEEIGFHKGAINTLVNERNEIIKMMNNVEIIMHAHLKRLEELGVNIQPLQKEKNR